MPRLLAHAALGVVLCCAAFADDPPYMWRYYRPGNTGIPGDSCQALWIAPYGDPSIGGYDPLFEGRGERRGHSAVPGGDGWRVISRLVADLPQLPTVPT